MKKTHWWGLWGFVAGTFFGGTFLGFLGSMFGRKG